MAEAIARAIFSGAASGKEAGEQAVERRPLQEPPPPQPRGHRASIASTAEAHAVAAAGRPPVPEEMALMPTGSKVMVNYEDYALELRQVAKANAANYQRMREIAQSGALLRSVQESFAAFDQGRTGFLTWAGGGIRDFVKNVFSSHELLPPADGQIYHMYARFDTEKNARLSQQECLCMVDVIFKALFYALEHEEAPMNSVLPPPVPVREVGSRELQGVRQEAPMHRLTSAGSEAGRELLRVRQENPRQRNSSIVSDTPTEVVPSARSSEAGRLPFFAAPPGEDDGDEIWQDGATADCDSDSARTWDAQARPPPDW